MKTIVVKASVLLCIVALFSCNSSKKLATVPSSQLPESKRVESLEGEKVNQEISRRTGIEMGDALSDDGTAIVKTPYKWYSGDGKADNKQVATEIAQSEAYNTISRVMSNIVDSKIEQGELANNGKVQQAVRSHWKQVSQTVLKGCEPYGDVVTQFNPKDKMYDVNAKVAIRGDQYKKILSEATSYKPAELSGDELDQFIETNNEIIEAAIAK